MTPQPTNASPTNATPTNATPTNATPTSSGGERINLEYRALQRLSGELVDIAKAVEHLKQPLLSSAGTFPTTAFGLVAESGDAFMAYRKRVAALNTEAEATEAELVGMSDALTTTAADFRKHSAATAGALDGVQRKLDLR